MTLLHIEIPPPGRLKGLRVPHGVKPGLSELVHLYQHSLLQNLLPYPSTMTTMDEIPNARETQK